MEYDSKSGRDKTVVAVRNSNFEIQNVNPPRELHVNPHNSAKAKENQVILFWEDDTVSNYELTVYSVKGSGANSMKGVGK
eukprot:UN15591